MTTYSIRFHYSKLLKLARLIERERALNKQARALRDQITGHNGGYYSSVTFSGDNVTLQVSEAQWLQTELPDGIERPKPVMQEFRGENFPQPYGRLFYQAIWVGEFAAGKHLWITACSEKFDLPAGQPANAVAA